MFHADENGLIGSKGRIRLAIKTILLDCSQRNYMPNVPILFHDIDGVLFGHYAGEFQLRPGVKSWLAWAHEHFELIWLTSWESERIHSLLRVLCCDKFGDNLESPPFHHANWTNYENKVVWVQQAVQKLNGREWFWIDDEIEKFSLEIESAGIPLGRCIQSNPTGRDELLSIQSTLNHCLANRNMNESDNERAA
ncbi:hypothetical protein W02_36070 [Nitrospira sp. KM1]|nr:hypothetical protein W02_36070 [Nitrospira sp. KM1]